MVRREAKAATRKALLASAQSAFADRGFDGTSVADIARGAGVATGTFYVHFASKEAAVDELLATFNQGLAGRLAGVLGARGGLEARVRAVADAFLAECQEHRALLNAYLERSRAHLDPAALRDGVNPPAYALVRAAIAEQAIGDPELELATHGLLALWMRVALQQVWKGTMSRADAADVLATMTLGAVRALRARERNEEKR